MLEILWLSINNCGHCRVSADGGESLRALAGWFLARMGRYWLEMEIKFAHIILRQLGNHRL